MFFSISKQQQNNFTFNYNLGPLWINVDSGWKNYSDNRYFVLYKGYAENYCLETILDKVRESRLPFDLGNYCVLFFDKKTRQVLIRTDRYRSFPIYVKLGDTVTNLQKLHITKWSDNIITVNHNITIEEYQFDIIGKLESSIIDYDTILSSISELLHNKIEKFIKNNHLPIKVFLSGGVDTLLVYSYLRSHTDKFELVKCSHIDYDRFWLLNDTDIQQNWGYQQIHHWTDPCILTSGAPGDEYFLRSPTTVDLYLKYRNLNILNLLDDPEWRNCLHRDYFMQEKHLKIFKNQTVNVSDTINQHHRDLCNKNVNDWQHWHLGNTLTWTPLRDLEIFKLMLRLPLNYAIAQILDSKLSKDLISLVNPDFVNLISDQKNSKYPMKNLVDLLIN
jgi:hypothetical protein